jgi:hypothetical protein
MTDETVEVVENVVKKEATKRVARKKVETAEQILDATPNISDDPLAALNIEKIMVKMNFGEAYYSPNVEFTKADPFQLVEPLEANYLINEYPNKFVIASKKMVEDFYKLG